jgi:hypothetical protein
MRFGTVMRQDTADLALLIELHHLGGTHVVDAVVFQHATPHTGVEPDELKLQ